MKSLRKGLHKSRSERRLRQTTDRRIFFCASVALILRQVRPPTNGIARKPECVNQSEARKHQELLERSRAFLRSTGNVEIKVRCEFSALRALGSVNKDSRYAAYLRNKTVAEVEVTSFVLCVNILAKTRHFFQVHLSHFKIDRFIMLVLINITVEFGA